MEGKFCPKCGERKAFEEFYKSKSRKDGYDSKCKKCDKAYKQANKERFSKRKKDYNQAFKEKNPEYNKVYYRVNKEKIDERNKENYHANKEQYSERMKEWRRENKEKVLEYNKEYYGANKEKCSEKAKEWRKRNKKIIAERKKKYSQENKEKIAEYKKVYCQSEHGREKMYKWRLKRRSYKHKVIFKPHERKSILDRDNWECQSCGIKVHDRRTGKWDTPDKAHIDHIIPISKGGNSEPKNLRVLCRTCNLSKQDKLDEQLTLL